MNIISGDFVQKIKKFIKILSLSIFGFLIGPFLITAINIIFVKIEILRKIYRATISHIDDILNFIFPSLVSRFFFNIILSFFQ